MTIHETHIDSWKVTVVDTGYNTMTGGRIKRIQKYVGNETFLMTYGDGVCDVDINDLIAFIRSMVRLPPLLQLRWRKKKVS